MSSHDCLSDLDDFNERSLYPIIGCTLLLILVFIGGFINLLFL